MHLRNKLLARRAEILKEAQANLDAAATAGGMTEEMRKTDDRLHAEMESVKADLVRCDRQAEAARALRDTSVALLEPDDEEVPGAPAKPLRLFSSFGEQVQAVIAAARPGARIDERLNKINQSFAVASGMSEGVGADGGFFVQRDFSQELLRRVYETGLLPPLCKRIPIGAGSNGLKINAVDETSRVTTRWGGIVAYWIGEAQAKTASAPKFRQIELDLKKLVGLVYLTDELMADATALEGFVQQGFAEEFGFQLDDKIINGTGAGVPRGILGSAARVTVAKEAGQAAATVVAANVEKMYARLFAQSMANAKWFINQMVWPQLFQLSHAVGTGGVPVFVPAGGISAAPFGTLLGRPIQPIEQCAALGTEGDIILWDPSRYLLIEKGGIESAISMHVKFTTDETTLRFVLRVDGQPIEASAITPYKGADTLSSIVTLATRS